MHGRGILQEKPFIMSVKIRLPLAFICLIICFRGYAVILHVPSGYPSIQQAINASSNSDTVAVDPGIYFENINFNGKKIVLTSLFYLTHDTSYITSTVINGSTPVHPDTASCVIMSNGEDSTTVLQGFTITGGRGTRWLDAHGAGTYREGGGILLDFTSPVIQYNRIIDNYASNSNGANGAGGGGLRISDGNPQILNNVIAYNNGKYGPGIVLNYTGCVIRNNIIAFNTGGSTFSGGGAIWTVANFGTVPKILENNTIFGNHATVGTGGVLCQGTNLILKNNIIWNNTSPNNTQIYSLSGGSATVSYCNVKNGYAGNGNISIDPLFTDTNNFYLSPFSLSIDAGDSSLPYNDAEDLLNPGYALYPAMGGLRNDMGAYGGPRGFGVGQGVYTSVPETTFEISGLQVFPNPGAGEFQIQFNSEIKNNVRIVLYDLAGRSVLEREVSWMTELRAIKIALPESVSSGTYIMAVSAGQSISRKKLMVNR